MDIGHHYLQYSRLMQHWQALFGCDILDVSYDGLVKDPRPAVERILAFLGLEWDERCLKVPPQGRAVKTASVWQVREPLYQYSSGRARHYERQLNSLRKYLDGSA
jgi:LPS sulfotransferase NodH